jgi:vesicle coat complex subunit
MVQAQAPKPGGSSYFEKKGEVHELRQLLRGAAADRDQQKKRDAIKKVIAYMTLGIDVSPLFSEMVMASATTDLVQKKMVYLYLVNYAESNSELAILAINTLQKDCRDDDPMIRGLALRSLCSLNLVNMVEYLHPAVKTALEDVNGYVRKTAVIGVVKVFNISRQMVLDSPLIDIMKRMVHDSDAHVVANTIYALEEVLVDEGGYFPTKEIATMLLNRLQQFSEWGQCAVLGVLTKYRVADEGEMFDIMNILDALLKQSSSAVVLAVTKIFMDLTSNRRELQLEVMKRLRAPLLTLMATATPELAYTVLVHIQALCMRGVQHSEVFGSEFKQFFCRYNEPSYIKTVKIDILTSLADANSSEAIVQELSEYVTDVDAEISRRSIQAIGKVAVNVPSTAELIVGTLATLLELDIDYVSTEAAVVMKDLVRKYPEQFERASGAVERCIKIVTEPEGKCALLWILGEYGLLIEDAPYLLEPMIDGFLEETSGSVRLEMLTATVKLFFCRPPEMQTMLGRLLQKAIQETTHPDVRDRALLYYRLLEHSPEEARRVICAPKEVVEAFQEEMDADVRERLMDEFNTLSVVYKQPSSKFVLNKVSASMVAKMEPPPLDGPQEADEMEEKFSAPARSAPITASWDPSPAPAAETADLLGEALGSAPAQQSPPPPAAAVDLLGMGDLLGDDSTADTGFGGIGFNPVDRAAPQFTLAHGVQMSGPQFEAKFQSLPAAGNHQRQMRPVPQLNTAVVEEALRQRGIHVIASGPQPGGLKFFFFAKQATGPAAAGFGGDIFFFLELNMSTVPGGIAQASVKADNAQAESVALFVGTLWEALDGLVIR